MTFIFILGYPNPRNGALRGGLGGLQGVLSPILPNIMCYVNSGVLNSGKSKNYPYFHFWVPQPPQGRPQGGAGGKTGGVESYTTKNHVLCQFWGSQ